MKFAASLLLAASTSAMELDTTQDIPATSALGSRILSKSRMLEGNADYTSWVAGYSIKFDRCISSANYYGGYFANNQNQNQADGEYEQFQYDVRVMQCPSWTLASIANEQVVSCLFVLIFFYELIGQCQLAKW